MKEAKRHGGMHRCGNCTRTIKLRHDHGRLACTAHLTVVAADHAPECDEYEPAAGQELPTAAEAVPASTDSTKAP